MQDTKVLSLGQGDPLEEEVATHSSTLDWEIPITEEPDGLQSIGPQESDVAEQLSMPAHKYNINLEKLTYCD